MWPVVKPEGRGEGEEGVVCLWSGCAVQWLVGVKVQHYLAPPSWCFIWMNTLRTTNTILHSHLPFWLTPTTTQHSSLQIQNNNKQYFFTSAPLASGIVHVIILHLLLIVKMKWIRKPWSLLSPKTPNAGHFTSGTGGVQDESIYKHGGACPHVSDWSRMITWPEYWPLIGQSPAYFVAVSSAGERYLYLWELRAVTGNGKMGSELGGGGHIHWRHDLYSHG